MFPKPPRPEPPRRAVATQVVQQRVTAPAIPTVLVVDQPVPPAAPGPAGEAEGNAP